MVLEEEREVAVCSVGAKEKDAGVITTSTGGEVVARVRGGGEGRPCRWEVSRQTDSSRTGRDPAAISGFCSSTTCCPYTAYGSLRLLSLYGDW
jgi:hypothetical protein